jgi:hypothetical protein
VEDPLGSIGRLFAEAGIPYAVIGGHAVNAWLEPRFTADIDVTVVAGSDTIATLKRILAALGLAVSRQYGSELPSGPDFVRFASPDGAVILEVQTAKTAFQRELVDRAVGERFNHD